MFTITFCQLTGISTWLPGSPLVYKKLSNSQQLQLEVAVSARCVGTVISTPAGLETEIRWGENNGSATV